MTDEEVKIAEKIRIKNCFAAAEQSGKPVLMSTFYGDVVNHFYSIYAMPDGTECATISKDRDDIEHPADIQLVHEIQKKRYETAKATGRSEVLYYLNVKPPEFDSYYLLIARAMPDGMIRFDLQQ